MFLISKIIYDSSIIKMHYNKTIFIISLKNHHMRDMFVFLMD